MAGSLVATEGTELNRFLFAARRQLWAEAVVDAVVPGLWGSAALVAATSLWHLLVASVPLATSVVAGVLPLVISLGRPLVSGRPGQAATAAEADRRLASGNLLATAVELAAMSESRRPGAAGIVFAQANACSESTQRLPGEDGRRPLAPQLVLPLAVICVSGLIHVAPQPPASSVSADTDKAAASGTIREVVEDVQEASPRPGSADRVEDIASQGSDAVHTGSGRIPMEPDRGREPESIESASDKDGAVRSAPLPAADIGPGTGEASGDGGSRDIAGDDRPDANARASTTPEAVIATRRIGVDRPSAGSGFGAGGRVSPGTAIRDDGPPVVAGPAASAATLPVEGAAWTPALRAYAADYLSRAPRPR